MTASTSPWLQRQPGRRRRPGRQTRHRGTVGLGSPGQRRPTRRLPTRGRVGAGRPGAVRLSRQQRRREILGSEPVIVDCGSLNGTGWLDDVFGLVAPEDVRWVFLSHDDADHTANVGPVMEACPRGHARLQLGPRRALCQRLRVPALEMPLGEPRRRLQCRRPDPRGPAPPVYDSPTTRGLLDTTTGVYWAADAFATPVPGGPGASPPDHVNELDPELWWGGMVM